MNTQKVVINRLGLRGDGVADGPIYVPRTLPGEVVEGDVVDDRILSPRIITPSEMRRKPPCRHFKICGGCALQHAKDEFVAGWKVNLVRDALKHQGITAELETIHTSPAHARRRAVLHGKRTKSGAQVGFHTRGTDRLVEVPDCQLLTAPIMEAFPVFEALTIGAASRRGVLAIRVIDTGHGLDVGLDGGKELDMELRQVLAECMRSTTIIRLTYDDEVIGLDHPPSLTFGTASVVVPAGAFLQATEAGEQALVTMMMRAVEGAERVVDLFSGCGTFSLPLAQNAEVLAVETEAGMLEVLDRGWRGSTGLKKVSICERDLFRQPFLAEELDKFDGIVLDPPRPGALAQCSEIAKCSVATVGFVSCNPVTFARDAKTLLDGGYVLDWIEVVDQFRWSTHVEISARFIRR